jgi:hypothetical protein
LDPGEKETEVRERSHNDQLNNLYSSTKYYEGDEVKEDDMGAARRTHGIYIYKECLQNFDRKILREEATWNAQPQTVGCQGMVQWRAVVNTAMNLQVP